MKARISLLVITFLTCQAPLVANKATTETKKRNSQTKPSSRPCPQNYQQMKQEDHEKICSILGYASNIFGNFVQLVRESHSQENVGEQVGNMAENVFHIVAEATKAKIIEDPDSESAQILEYLSSENFKEDLQKIIDEILENEEKHG